MYLKESLIQVQQIFFSFQKQNIWTVPNFLTSIRIAMAPLLGYLVLHESYHLACGMFIVAGVSDLVNLIDN